MYVKLTFIFIGIGASYCSRCFSCSSQRPKSVETDLARQLKAKIKITGPITVAEYMKEVLTNPVAVSICRSIHYDLKLHYL